MALAYDRGDDLEPPFGLICSLNSSFARLVTASSASSSRMRLRTAASSTDSAVVTPGLSPPIDQILVAPVVDRLARHTELLGDLSDRRARLDQIQDLAPELGRITSRHDDLLGRRARDSTIPTARYPGQTDPPGEEFQ